MIETKFGEEELEVVPRNKNWGDLRGCLRFWTPRKNREPEKQIDAPSGETVEQGRPDVHGQRDPPEFQPAMNNTADGSLTETLSVR